MSHTTFDELFGENIAEACCEGNVADTLGTEKKFCIASLPISIAWTTFFGAKESRIILRGFNNIFCLHAELIFSG